MAQYNEYFESQMGEPAGHDEETIKDLNQIKRDETPVKDIEDEASKMANMAGAIEKDIIHTDEEYFQMVNPDTGKHYDLPLISPTQDGYRNAYICAMRMKTVNPELFKKYYPNV